MTTGQYKAAMLEYSKEHNIRSQEEWFDHMNLIDVFFVAVFNIPMTTFEDAEKERRTNLARGTKTFLKKLHLEHVNRAHDGVAEDDCTWKNSTGHCFVSEAEIVVNASKVLPTMWRMMTDFDDDTILLRLNNSIALRLRRGKPLKGKIRNSYGKRVVAYSPVVVGDLAHEMPELPLSTYLYGAYGKRPRMRVVGSDFKVNPQQLKLSRAIS